ncbi:hypothetical protein L7F22_033701 [Adiantum nelumboides]|nr:hypothetical protein [Adiantum nelumboides]
MSEFLQLIGRKVAVVNLDPANDSLPYKCAVNIEDLIRLDDVMNEHGLGPNGDLSKSKPVPESELEIINISDSLTLKPHLFGQLCQFSNQLPHPFRNVHPRHTPFQLLLGILVEPSPCRHHRKVLERRRVQLRRTLLKEQMAAPQYSLFSITTRLEQMQTEVPSGPQHTSLRTPHMDSSPSSSEASGDEQEDPDRTAEVDYRELQLLYRIFSFAQKKKLDEPYNSRGEKRVLD